MTWKLEATLKSNLKCVILLNVIIYVKCQNNYGFVHLFLFKLSFTKDLFNHEQMPISGGEFGDHFSCKF